MEPETASPQPTRPARESRPVWFDDAPPFPAREGRLGAITVVVISLLLSVLDCLDIVLSWLPPQPAQLHCSIPWWNHLFNTSAVLLISVSFVFGIVALNVAMKWSRGLGIMNIILAASLFLAA